MDTIALILFVDARGFTRWADSPEVFPRLNEFATDFNAVLATAFPGRRYFHKGLGDGGMIVRELKGGMTAADARDLLADTLERVGRANAEFARVCKGFAESMGHPADLRLGWGITRGPVQKLTSPAADYVGPNVNKCARLCAQARPFGVLIDRDDFPKLPAVGGFKFFEQDRLLGGVAEPVRVWVTEEVASQFLTREQVRQRPEVHVAGQCVDAEGRARPRILIARRSKARRLFPDRYEGCGGQLAANETFAEGVARHFRMEMRLEVRPREDLHRFYAIRERNEPLIPGIRFLCELAGPPEGRSANHSELRWVTEAEFRGIPADQFVPGLREQVLELLAEYKRQR